MNRAQQRDRKATQLQRIRAAMIEVVAAEGYARTSIARVIARAGVSRPTFYDYFAAREECMLAVIELARGELYGLASTAVAAAAGRDAFTATVDALVSFADEQPALARVLYGEAMAAGPRALDARDRAVTELEALIEDAYAQLKPTASIPDLPGAIAIGAVFRLLGHRLRRRDPQLQETRPRLLDSGYAGVSVEEMARRAGVEMRTFYRMYAGKQEAFAALAEVYFQHMMALTAGAFFSGRGWPERVLDAKVALGGCVEANPAVARACFIDAHAGGRDGGERIEQLTSALTMFLSEGRQLCDGRAGASRLGREAIAHANFELVYRQARASDSPRMAGVVAHSVHLCLAPFIGVAGAQELIERELAAPATRRRENGAPPVADEGDGRS